MIERRVKIGAIGMFILLGSLGGLLYALSAPREISYSTAQYYPPVDREYLAEEIVYSEKLVGRFSILNLLPYALPIVFLAFLWLIALRKKSGLPFQGLMQNIGKLWSYAYPGAVILAAAYLVFAFISWQSGETGPTIQTLYPSEVSLSEQGSDYFAMAEVNGPRELRFGSSDVISLKMWISKGTSENEYTKLSPNMAYWVQASIQAVNFDISEDSYSKTGQTLALDHPILWSWILSPKERRLGTQSVIIRVNLMDEDKQGEMYYYKPYLHMRIDVRDPLGLPSSIVYGAMVLGSIMGWPFWTWLLDKWITNRKEKPRLHSRDTDEGGIFFPQRTRDFSESIEKKESTEKLKEGKNQEKENIEESYVSEENISKEEVRELTRHERKRIFFESLARELNERRKNGTDSE